MNQGDDDPQAFAAAFARGDSKAVSEVWKKAHAYVRRRVHEPEDAKDLTQECVARVQRVLCKRALDDTHSFWGYLYSALYRDIIKFWARRSRHGGKMAADDLPDPRSVAIAEKTFEQLAAERAVQEALLHMDPECQGLLVARFVRQEPLQEIADQLSESYEAVRKRFQRCHEKLKAAFRLRYLAEDTHHER